MGINDWTEVVIGGHQWLNRSSHRWASMIESLLFKAISGAKNLGTSLLNWKQYGLKMESFKALWYALKNEETVLFQSVIAESLKELTNKCLSVFRKNIERKNNERKNMKEKILREKILREKILREKISREKIMREKILREKILREKI